jgi:diguanylate cyclase (GGDEF)-like protein/PAS domain S-box-containing protein
MDQYRLAVSGERDGLWDWDLASNRVHFSPRWLAMVGCDDGEVGNGPEEWFGRIHPDDRPRVERDIEAHAANGASTFEVRHRIRHRDGSYRWVACRGIVVRDGNGVAIRIAGAHADVTADHSTDPVTGLPNREMFLDRLARAIERARRSPDFLYSVVLVDLEPSPADESPAQGANDPLLTAAARRLETCLRGVDASAGTDYVVARLRGSQFAILLEGLTRVGEAQAAAERTLTGLIAPLALRGRQVFPRASLGIAVSATGYTAADEVLRDADAAVYRARSLGGNRCEVFDLELVHSARKRLELEADIEQALSGGQFRLFYQPVVEAGSGRIVGLEALARWQHPTRGLLPPEDFIPAAEETGFIVALESWTLREACRQLKAWQASLPIAAGVWVSVNLSGAHVRVPGLLERVGDSLREAALDPACLVLELTESVVIDDPAAVRTLLMQLRVMGVRVGIDDFGTGHSSFAYLHQFPADFLKVDQSLTRGMEVRTDKADIVGTLAGLAAQLGLEVIAEGIESRAGLDLARARGCTYLQGFLFSRPVSADAAEDLLRNGGVAVVDASESGRQQAPGAPENRPPVRASRTAAAFSGRRGFIHVGLAALALVAAVGLPGRFTKAPVGPPLPSRPRALATASPLVPLAPPPGLISATGPITSPSGSPGLSAAKPSVPRRATIVVEHRHAFGGCRGVLRMSPAGLSFASDDAKDLFAFEHGRFEYALGGDTLTIKDGRRTYRFKAAGATGNDASQPPLQAIVNAIAALQPK